MGKSNRERQILYLIHMSNLKKERKKTETVRDTENIQVITRGAGSGRMNEIDEGN